MGYIVLVILSVLIVYGIDITIKRRKLEAKIQELYMEVLSLELAHDKLREFKHNYSNFLQCISGCIYLRDFEMLEKLFIDIKSGFDLINTIPVLENHFNNCPPFYGLLLNKINIAELNNTQLHINVLNDIDFERLSNLDMVKILGNLIDNAIEAAKNSRKKSVEIKFNIVNYIQEIIISNSYSGEIKEDKLFINGYTTKEGHTGLGLYEVAKIIDKSKNISLKTKIGDEFIQTITVV